MNECRSWVYEPRRSKIDSSKEIVGECKNNAVTNLRKLTLYNNLDLVNINACAKFGQNPSICSQDSERK